MVNEHKPGIAARVYSINQERLDEALWKTFTQVFMELGSDSLKEKAREALSLLPDHTDREAVARYFHSHWVRYHGEMIENYDSLSTEGKNFYRKKADRTKTDSLQGCRLDQILSKLYPPDHTNREAVKEILNRFRGLAEVDVDDYVDELLPLLHPEPKVLSDEERKLRDLLWATHSCSGKYCDDGEIQCGAYLPTIDFLRDTPEDIGTKIPIHNAQAQLDSKER